MKLRCCSAWAGPDPGRITWDEGLMLLSVLMVTVRLFQKAQLNV